MLQLLIPIFLNLLIFQTVHIEYPCYFLDFALYRSNILKYVLFIQESLLARSRDLVGNICLCVSFARSLYFAQSLNPLKVMKQIRPYRPSQIFLPTVLTPSLTLLPAFFTPDLIVLPTVFTPCLTLLPAFVAPDLIVLPTVFTPCLTLLPAFFTPDLIVLPTVFTPALIPLPTFFTPSTALLTKSPRNLRLRMRG